MDTIPKIMQNLVSKCLGKLSIGVHSVNILELEKCCDIAVSMTFNNGPGAMVSRANVTMGKPWHICDEEMDISPDAEGVSVCMREARANYANY